MKSLIEYINERQLGQGWKSEESINGKYVATILSFDQPSRYGIDGGKISKLTIQDKKNKSRWLCNFDRGWDIEPEDEVRDFYDEIIKKYN